MKKILIGATAAAALILSFGAGASAAPGFNASKYCTDNADFGYGHGDCTSIITKVVNKTGSDDATAFCQEFQLVDPAGFDTAFKNLGDCVKSLH